MEQNIKDKFRTFISKTKQIGVNENSAQKKSNSTTLADFETFVNSGLVTGNDVR